VGNIQNTLFPILKEDFGINNYQVGILSSVPPLLQAVFSLPAGWISDKHGSKKVVFGSLIMLFLGALLASLSRNPWMYVFAAILMTLSSTAFHPPAFCYIADVTKPKNRSKYMGLFNAGGTLGMSLGPLSISLVVGILAKQLNQLYLIWTIPIIIGLGFLWALGVNDSKNPVDTSLVDDANGNTGFLNKEFIMYIFSRGLRMLGIGLFSPFLSIYLVEIRSWSITQIGLMMGMRGVIGLICAPIGGVLASKFGEKNFVIVSTILSAIFFIAAFYTSSILIFMALYLAYRGAVIMAYPGQATITAKLSPPEHVGMGFALTFLPASVSGIAAPIIAAWIIDYFGYMSLFNTSAVTMLFATLLFWLAIKSD
jgi:MFS family permease